MANIDRDFLRLVWYNRLFETMDLSFSDSRVRSVISLGSPSVSNCYTFVGAQIKDILTGDVIQGAVRIDERSSDFVADDPNIVLHVVSCRDKVLLDGSVERLTCVVSARESLVECRSRMAIDCERYLASMEKIRREAILLRLVSQRMERKGREIIDIYRSLDNSWSEALYVSFMRSFGYKEKKADFESLARSVSYRYISRHAHRQHLVEALLLGQAGYLDVPIADQYTEELRAEWFAIKGESPMNAPILDWSGARTRPDSLPAISIVRAAAILTRAEDFLQSVLLARTVADLFAIFDIQLSPYWRYHHAPGRKISGRISSGELSRDKLELIIINTVTPFWWAYGTVTGDDRFVDQALEILDKVGCEDNMFTRRFASHGVELLTAFDSQSIIELSTMFCKSSQCTACALGTHRLREAFFEGCSVVRQ